MFYYILKYILYFYVQHIKITYFTTLYNDELYYFVAYTIYIKMMKMLLQISGERIDKLSHIRKLYNLMQKYILE